MLINLRYCCRLELDGLIVNGSCKPWIMARASRRPQMSNRISVSRESFLCYRLQESVCKERFIVRAFSRSNLSKNPR